MNPVCSFSNIQNHLYFHQPTKCDFALTYCTEETTYINSVSLYYCNVNENILLMILISILWLLFCFYWLSSTSENFLEPILSKVTSFFGFSESLAGVTLVSFANGAPDIISTYAASEFKQEEGVGLVFGALFGASIFTTTIVLARVLQKAENIQLKPSTLMRDCLFYAVAELYLFYLGTVSIIKIPHAICFIFIYLVFLIWVVFQEMRTKKNEAILNVLDLSSKPDQNNLFSQFHNEIDDSNIRAINLPINQENNQIEKIRRLSLPHDDSVQNTSRLSKFQDNFENPSIKHMINTCSIIWGLIEIPFNWIRYFTIPQLENSFRNRKRIAFYPFFIGLVTIWQLRLMEKQWDKLSFWLIYIVITVFLGLCFWFFTKIERLHKVLAITFLTTGIIMSIIWIRFAAELLVDLLILFKIASGLPTSFIGLTVLAWGNSFNDYFVDVALAKKGRGIMAVSGIFGGQFFNMQIGFGLLLLRNAGNITLGLYYDNIYSHLNYLLAMFSLVSIISTLLYGLWNKFYMNKKYGLYLVALYFSFFVTIMIATLVGE